MSYHVLLRKALKPVTKVCVWWHKTKKAKMNRPETPPNETAHLSAKDLATKPLCGRYSKKTSQESFSPMAGALHYRWKQARETLALVDDQPLLFWWSKQCSRDARKTFRHGLKEIMDMIDGYLRDDNLCKKYRDFYGVGRRLHQEVGMKFSQRILIPLEESCEENGRCADFENLVHEVLEIKRDIQLLVEEALLREEIDESRRQLRRGTL